MNTDPAHPRRADTILAGLGGPENVVSVTPDHTRLAVCVADIDRLDHAQMRSARLSGWVSSRHRLSLVIGGGVEALASLLQSLISARSTHDETDHLVEPTDRPGTTDLD